MIPRINTYNYFKAPNTKGLNNVKQSNICFSGVVKAPVKANIGEELLNLVLKMKAHINNGVSASVCSNPNEAGTVMRDIMPVPLKNMAVYHCLNFSNGLSIYNSKNTTALAKGLKDETLFMAFDPMDKPVINFNLHRSYSRQISIVYKDFTDKSTGILYKAGDIYNYGEGSGAKNCDYLLNNYYVFKDVKEKLSSAISEVLSEKYSNL